MDLYEEHNREIQRMPAVLLGVASAAIAFAFHETADSRFSWSLLPILGAVLCWAGSFASGVLFSRAYASSIRGNIAMNIAEASRPDRRDEAKEMFEGWNAKSSKRYAAQQWLLLAGAVLYLVGHVWSIWETPQTRTSEVNSEEASRIAQPPVSTASPPPVSLPEQTSQPSPQ